MRAGTLRDRVTIQNKAEGKDAYNQPNGEWSDELKDLACNLQDLSGQELVNARLMVAECTVKITVRGFTGWRSRIKPSSRAVAGERTFDIKAIVNPDGVNRELQILALEIVR